MSIGITSLLSAASDHHVRALVPKVLDGVFIDGPWEGRHAAMREGRAVGGWICGLLHTELQAGGDWPFEAVAAPPSPRPDHLGQPVYFGDVVVSADSDVTDFAHLRGRTFAFNEQSSLSGHRMMMDRLATEGADLSFFGGTVRSGSHLTSIQMVINGTADCAIIDSTLIDDAVEGVDQMRIVTSVGPYPAPPLVAAGHTLDRLRALGVAAGWIPVDEGTYDVLRA